jgi:RHS repeat-associated protein
MPFLAFCAPQGGWGTSTGKVAGSSFLPDNLTLNSRSGNTPPEYKAKAEIDMNAGFESATGDSFDAYITDGTTSSGGTGATTASATALGYPYGFNGKENDDDVKGKGNQIAFENRIYDPRSVRWYSLDPLQKEYPGETPYGFVSGNPIVYADGDGRDKIYTLTLINKEGRSTTIQRVDKDFFVYKHIEVPGFGNDRYYKQDLLVNMTIDLRGHMGKATYSEELGNRTEISAARYGWNNVTEFLGNLGKEGSRGSQAGGITLTSEFASQVDGPKTDATKGTSGSVNVDPIMAAFSAYAQSGELLKFDSESLPEWATLVKDFMEAKDYRKEVKKEKVMEKEGTEAKGIYSKYKKNTILHTETGNIRVLSDSTGQCCQDDKKATDTLPGAKVKKE